MSLRWFNSFTRRSLAPYSGARDGRIGVRELTGVVGDMVQAKVEARVWLYMLCVLAAVAVVLLGCSFGLTWAVVLAHKDTQVKRGTWVARGTDDPIMVGSVSYAVNRSSHALSARGSGAALATGELLRRRPLHSGMGLGQLQGLTRVLLRSSRGAQVALRVTGVTLVPLEPGGTAGGTGASPSPASSPASAPSPSSAATSLHISTPGGVLQVVGGELRAGGVAPGMAGEEGDTWTGPVIGIFSTDAPT